MEALLLHVQGIYQTSRIGTEFPGAHCRRCMVLSDVLRHLSPFCPADSCKLEMSQFWPLPSYLLSLISERVSFRLHPHKHTVTLCNSKPLADIRTE